MEQKILTLMHIQTSLVMTPLPGLEVVDDERPLELLNYKLYPLPFKKTFEPARAYTDEHTIQYGTEL